MPRGKKTPTNNKKELKKKTKKDEDEEDSLEEIIEDDEEEAPKKTKKKTAQKSKGKSKKAESEEEDELSDIDDEEDDNSPLETNENDEVVTSNKPDRPPIKVVDPKTPIGKLKTDEILSYLIQQGTDSLNPQLKYGALNLLKQLTGRQRRPQPSFQTGGRGNFNPRGSFSQRGGRPNNGGRGASHSSNHQQRAPSSQRGDLYEDDDQ